MSTIVLNTLNYVGEGIQNGVARYIERSAGVVAFFRNLTASVSHNEKSARTVVKWKLVLPFPDSPSAECPCDGTLPFRPTIVNIDVKMDSRADNAYRTAVQLAISDLALKDEFKDSIKLPATPVG